MDLSISWLLFILIAIGNFILSWLYYSPAAPWFKAWQVGVGVDPNKTEMTEEDKKAMPRLMIGAVVASFLLSYGLQIMVKSVGATDFISGAGVGFILWIGFAVTHSLNTQFEGRKPVVLLINHGLYLLTYLLFGGIIAIMV